METTIEKIPTYALNYFVNGDAQGLTDEDMNNIKEWQERSGVKEVIMPSDEDSEDAYFTYYPAFGLSTDVIECTCILEY